MEEPIKRSPAEWDRFFLEVAKLAASMSKDPGRKIGAVLVSQDRRQLSFGYNGLPEGMPDLPSLLNDKDAKLEHMVHAEDNCLRQAPFSAEGATLYVYGRFPCTGCAEKVAERRVGRVVAPAPDFDHPRWGKSWLGAANLLDDAGIPCQLYLGEDQ